MQFCLLDRESFLDWLGGKPAPKTVRLTVAKMRKALESDIALIYDDGEVTTFTQPIIAISQDRLSDFYAFVGTYVTGYRPFSAFFRVVPFEAVFELGKPRANMQEVGVQINSLIGIAIAEVYTQSRGRVKAFDKISVSAVQATLSASLTEAVWQGYGSERISDISRRWQLARKLEDAGDLFVDPQKIAEVWGIVADIVTGAALSKARGPRKKVAQALKQAALTPLPNQELMLPFIKEFPTLAANVVGLSRSREERVRIVRNILPELVGSSSDLLTREFLAGAIVSMIGNGSFAQLSLLDDVLPVLPSAALWFGVVASFQNGNDAMTIGNCLGRRVARDMCTSDNLFAPIREDIAIDELKMLRSEATFTHPFRTAQAASVNVNLFGNVGGRFKKGGATNSKATRAEQDSKAREDREQTQELFYHLDRARQMARKLSRNREGNLFE